MAERGITGKAADDIVQGITSFALYGFPESHAASFALIAYASAYLKAHHPAAFLCALLNAWPMGFYHPATLVQDARRHGVRVLPDRCEPLGVRAGLKPWGRNGVRGSGLGLGNERAWAGARDRRRLLSSGDPNPNPDPRLDPDASRARSWHQSRW